MADSGESANKANDYFRLPPYISLILVPLGVGLVTMCTLCPQYVPFAAMGPVGDLAEYMTYKTPSVMHGIFVMMWLIHALEAYCASRVARTKGLSDSAVKKWTMAVFMYGVFAFKFLLAYQPPTPEPSKDKAE